MTGRRVGAGGLSTAVVGVLALAGCMGGSDDPKTPASSAAVTVESSPTPTVPADEAARQADIDDAIHNFEGYIRTDDRVGQGGYTQPEAIDNFFGDDDARSSAHSAYRQLGAAGVTQTGSTKIVSTEVVEYVGDPLDEAATHQIRLRVCLDYSGVDYFDTGGVDHDAEDLPPAIVANFTLQHFPADNRVKWKIMAEEYTDEGCS